MAQQAIKLSDISFRREQRDILSGVNLTVDYGDFLAITGPNGGGKTTLLRIILKLVAPSSGLVEYLSASGEPAKRLHIGYLPQKNMIDARFPITVEEVVASGLLNFSCGREADRRMVDDVLEKIELTSRRHAAIGELSGGQLQRTLFGRAIISKPDILVLDEPLSYLDAHFEQRIYSMLDRLKGSTTILLVSHQMNVIAEMADRHLEVDHSLREV